MQVITALNAAVKSAANNDERTDKIADKYRKLMLEGVDFDDYQAVDSCFSGVRIGFDLSPDRCGSRRLRTGDRSGGLPGAACAGMARTMVTNRASDILQRYGNLRGA